ncbi:MAG: dephospho-CoA kinase [Synechococcales bacterium]|nr:dephospho-CoA kinase [Synechococcales bacterium]
MTNQTPLSSPPYRRIIGLTGGIGMGKTTVSDYLAKVHHLPVLDADVFARDAVQPPSPILNKIVERYGRAVLLPDGTLDRLRIGELVFSSGAERLWLEQQIHPYVRDRFESALQSPPLQSAPIVVLVIPLLFEARMVDLVNEIWVVYCSDSQQEDRLMERLAQSPGSRPDKAQVRARISSQMPIDKKKRRADVLLDNSAHPEALFKQVDAALAQPPQRVFRTN